MDKKPIKKGVRHTLLMGVFWRILTIEAVLLIYSLGYKWYTEDANTLDLFWYSVRIALLVIIIIVFMMVTLRKFLAQKIIAPLEAIASANKNFQENISIPETLDFSGNLPHEIETIIESRSKMYKTILNVSEDRLKYSNALNAELEKGKKIQKDFLPHYLPKAENCDISTFFCSALQMSGDFYDIFELPLNHIGFVVGDVSDKGVGSALFMALTRSLLRIFSGYFTMGSDSCRLEDINKAWTPEKALKAVSLTNEYLAKEHGQDGMFITLFICIIDPQTGKVFYVNGGHEPLLIIGNTGIKQQLSRTGPALGPIQGASYEIKSVQLESGDMLFSYTDGVTEARSEAGGLYSRSRLENLINKKLENSSDAFLEMIKTDLFAFIGKAPQSDDITMLALKWRS